MSKFKTADAKQREQATNERSARGLQYLNPEMQFQTYTPQDGDNSIRLVPPLGDDKHAKLWGMDVWVYYLGKRPYLSPKTFDEGAQDPVMDMYNKLKQEDAELAKEFKGTKRSLTFVLDMMDDEKLKIWAAPTTVIDEILKVSKNRRTGELIPVEDPEAGRIIFFNKTGQGVQTRYGAFALDTQACPLDDKIADELVHFQDLLIVPTAEELKGIMDNMTTGGGDGEAGDAAARPTARTRRPAEETTAAVVEADEPPFEPDNKPEAAATPPARTARTRPPAEAAATTSKPAETPAASAAPAGGDDLKARVAARIAARQNRAG